MPYYSMVVWRDLGTPYLFKLLKASTIPSIAGRMKRPTLLRSLPHLDPAEYVIALKTLRCNHWVRFISFITEYRIKQLVLAVRSLLRGERERIDFGEKRGRVLFNRPHPREGLARRRRSGNHICFRSVFVRGPESGERVGGRGGGAAQHRTAHRVRVVVSLTVDC